MARFLWPIGDQINGVKNIIIVPDIQVNHSQDSQQATRKEIS